MYKNARELLKKINDSGYESYIVGGVVRDYILGLKSIDVDICTNATPKEIKNIFKGAVMPSEKYGAVTLIYKKVRYEITTYRKEIKYDDYRRPSKLEYIDDLLEDLKRRDFTINTFCMDSDGNVIDLLNAKEDLDNKIIRTVGNPKQKLKEDVLRILRAIRFATSLNFDISDDVKKAIKKNRALLKKLSYTRKKEELTKIFTSPNAAYGISLIKELKLGKHLELSNLSTLKIVDDIMGIWAQLDVLYIYPFNKVEKETIKNITEVLKEPIIDNYILYKYGLYITTVVASIKGIDKCVINKQYLSLPIKERKEIAFDVDYICSKYNIKAGKWVKDVYLLLEKKILEGSLENKKEDINKYIKTYIDEKKLSK
ncbi:MAG TPA: CCA tRNA nucleotidyltransferase [Mollicutes bacterium]|nr:CCA tRNA nucleotidyltransferase [Mollicutes bacterium]